MRKIKIILCLGFVFLRALFSKILLKTKLTKYGEILSSEDAFDIPDTVENTLPDIKYALGKVRVQYLIDHSIKFRIDVDSIFKSHSRKKINIVKNRFKRWFSDDLKLITYLSPNYWSYLGGKLKFHTKRFSQYTIYKLIGNIVYYIMLLSELTA